MNHILESILYAIGAWIALNILNSIVIREFNHFKWTKFRREYLARWDLLNIDEQTELLYAERGTWVKEAEDHVQRVFRKNDKFMHIDLMINDDETRQMIAECPVFEKFKPMELDSAFLINLDKHWSAMKSSRDYDWIGTRIELQNLFENRVELANLIKSRLKR